MAIATAGFPANAAAINGLDTRVAALENPKTARGRTNGTTDGNGQVTVTHNLGVVPTHVLITIFDDGTNTLYTGRVLLSSLTTTQMKIQGRRTDTGAAAASGQSLNFFWEVKA